MHECVEPWSQHRYTCLADQGHPKRHQNILHIFGGAEESVVEQSVFVTGIRSVHCVQAADKAILIESKISATFCLSCFVMIQIS